MKSTYNPITFDNATDLRHFIIDTVKEELDKKDYSPVNIRIKYLDDEVTKLTKIDQGDWIDVYAAEDVVIQEGASGIIPLGFCMELPKGYEAHLAPRSSTFKKWGIIVTNSVGIIDESYNGDNDQWMLAVHCIDGKEKITLETSGQEIMVTSIKKNDKIAQFRIMKKMPMINFLEVDELGNDDRDGFGSTGTK